ncbi:MAG: YqgE/AlgH family protein [Flavobacteriaceae bacterium]
MMTGKLLVAHPSILGDQSFGRSVVLMAEHNEEGALGFVVNQHTHYTLGDLLPEMGIDAPVFQGGPVEDDRLFYIHTKKDVANALPLGNGLFWGGELEDIKLALLSNKLPSNQIKFLLGYAGWSKGQLAEETKTNAWLLVKNSYNLFENEEQLWGTILRDLGGELALYSFAPNAPGLN